MSDVEPLDVSDLREAFAEELKRRRFAAGPGCYANERDGEEALYGLTGAVNVCAALGLPLGDRAARKEWARRILAHRHKNGHFEGGSGPGHALHMVVGALNLLGEPIPADIGPLAPTDPKALTAWLDGLDWTTTHKAFCGETIPLLASGRVSDAWREAFVRKVAGRLNPDRPRETWCKADAAPWRVISCTYHVLSAFDAGRIPYPESDLLLRRLLGLRWEKGEDDVHRTICTDGDWALLLLRLRNQRPAESERIMQAIRTVSARRVRAWRADPEAVLSNSTHNLYCYLWVTAVFQSCVRDHYRGGFVKDTLNDPFLYRL